MNRVKPLFLLPLPLKTGIMYPIEQILSEVYTKYKDNQAIIISSPTATGKSTILPLDILKRNGNDGGKIIMLELRRHPYFWRSGNSAELDFLFENDGEIIPIEVKSATNTQAKSYRLFCKKYNIKNGFKLSLKNIATNIVEGRSTTSLPFYLAWNIENYF